MRLDKNVVARAILALALSACGSSIGEDGGAGRDDAGRGHDAGRDRDSGRDRDRDSGVDAAAPRPDGGPGDPCEAVSCSGHGTCSIEGGEAQCTCESGYHLSGPIACIEDVAPGDCSVALVLGHDDTAEPAPGARPARGDLFHDPTYGTCVVRATDHGDVGAGFTRHSYSRHQAFNADDTRLLVTDDDGNWHLYDAQTYAYVSELEGPGGDCEAQWHPTDPAKLRFMNPFGDAPFVIRELDIETGEDTVWRDFDARVRALWPSAASVSTKAEGSPSIDHRYWGFMVSDDAYEGLGVFVYDAVDDRIVGSYDFAEHGDSSPDHVSMSPSGRYLVVSWDDRGVVAFTRDFAEEFQVHDHGEHSDMARLPDGDDVFVVAVYDSELFPNGSVMAIDLDTHEHNVLVDDLYAPAGVGDLHISGRATDRPGWVAISFFGCEADRGECAPGSVWWQDKVVAVEVAMTGTPRVYNLAWHRSSVTEYFAEPQATVNRTFTRVVFASNWGGGGDIDDYQILIPDGIP